MGWSFQKRLTLFPGVQINLSGNGLSVSLGPKGLHLIISQDGISTSASIPGTGIRYRSRKRRL